LLSALATYLLHLLHLLKIYHLTKWQALLVVQAVAVAVLLLPPPLLLLLRATTTPFMIPMPHLVVQLSNTLVRSNCLLFLLVSKLATHTCTLVTIPVDVENLWKTPMPFKVYSAESLPGNGDRIGEYYHGYIIKMKVDPRDVAANFKFKATILNSNTIVVTAPALDYHDVGNDLDEEKLATANRPDPRGDNIVISEAFENGYVDFDTRKIVNVMQYHLRFTVGVIFSADVLLVHNGLREARLLLEASNVCVEVPFLNQVPEVAVDDAGNPLTDGHGNRYVYRNKMFVGYLMWRVADVSKPTRKQKTGQANAPTDGFEAMFGNMNLGMP
jgi:hypothetical protein